MRLEELGDDPLRKYLRRFKYQARIEPFTVYKRQPAHIVVGRVDHDLGVLEPLMIGTNRLSHSVLEDTIRKDLALLIDYNIALHTVD